MRYKHHRLEAKRVGDNKGKNWMNIQEIDASIGGAKVRIKYDRSRFPPDHDQRPLSAPRDVHGHNQCSPSRETAPCDSDQRIRFKLHWGLDKRTGTTTTLFHRVTSRC